MSDPSIEIQASICGVCGEVLDAPLVFCPLCNTQHHQDCWTYNQGCSIYGCGGTDAMTAPAVEEDQTLPQSSEEEFQEISLPLISMAGVLLLLGGGLASGISFAILGQLILFAILMRVLWGLLQRQGAGGLHAFSELEAGLDLDLGSPGKDVAKKKVIALLGQGNHHDLAQAYALFEQRHPRARFSPKILHAIAAELQEGGYRVLAGEVLEKCLAGVCGAEEELPRTLYRRLHREDPAFYAESQGLVLAETASCPRDPQNLLTGQPQYLLPLSVTGFPMEFRELAHLPTDSAVDSPQVGTFVVGPFSPQETPKKLSLLQTSGHTGIPVHREELRYTTKAESLLRISLTSKGARFTSATGDYAYPWEEVHAYFYARVECKEMRGGLEVEMPKQKEKRKILILRDKKTTTTRFDSILEVHAGNPPRRFRIVHAVSGLFDYLGRRRTLTFEANLRMAAKDLARFAPQARASRFLVAMFSERQGQEPHLASLRELEEQILWFTALGSRRVQKWWCKAQVVP
jgi:hypothetical protein